MAALATPSSKTWLASWDVSSKSDPNVSYKVSLKHDGTWACSCPRWRFAQAPKSDCKHIDGVKTLDLPNVTTNPQFANIVAAALAQIRERAPMAGQVLGVAEAANQARRASERRDDGISRIRERAERNKLLHAIRSYPYDVLPVEHLRAIWTAITGKPPSSIQPQPRRVEESFEIRRAIVLED